MAADVEAVCRFFNSETHPVTVETISRAAARGFAAFFLTGFEAVAVFFLTILIFALSFISTLLGFAA